MGRKRKRQKHDYESRNGKIKKRLLFIPVAVNNKLARLSVRMEAGIEHDGHAISVADLLTCALFHIVKIPESKLLTLVTDNLDDARGFKKIEKKRD